jgi:integrase
MPRLVGVPVILHDDGQFFHEASSYLRDRSLMRWCAGEGRGKPSLKRPSENTLRNLAGDLTHFFDFCAAVGADWRELGWSTLRGKRSIEGYISAMRARRHKVRGEMRIGLAPRTIEQRVTNAIDFLDYAASRDWRKLLPTNLPAVDLPPEPSSLEIPSPRAIRAWRDAVAERFEKDVSYHLLIESIMRMGLRREESALLRASDIPNAKALRPGEWQFLIIRYGTKGYREFGDPEKKGKKRKVRVSTDWVLKLIDYKNTRASWGRRAALAKFRKKNPGAPLPKELFLTTTKGGPITAEYVRLLWDMAGPRPHPSWTPHAGRHFYACMTLVDLIERDRQRAGIPGHLLLQNVDALGRGAMIELSEYLGHASPSTTDTYLRWVRAFFGTGGRFDA